MDKVVQLATAAFGLVAALAWNAAIRGLFTASFGEAGDLFAKFACAVVAAVAVVSVTEGLKGDENEEGAGAS